MDFDVLGFIDRDAKCGDRDRCRHRRLVADLQRVAWHHQLTAGPHKANPGDVVGVPGLIEVILDERDGEWKITHVGVQHDGIANA